MILKINEHDERTIFQFENEQSSLKCRLQKIRCILGRLSQSEMRFSRGQLELHKANRCCECALISFDDFFFFLENSLIQIYQTTNAKKKCNKMLSWHFVCFFLRWLRTKGSIILNFETSGVLYHKSHTHNLLEFDPDDNIVLSFLIFQKWEAKRAGNCIINYGRITS